MKKFVVVLAALVSLYACTEDKDLLGTEMTSLEMASKSSSSNVQLLKAWAANSSSPVHQSYIRRFAVKVKNLSYQKEVFIHHATKQGHWIDLPLTYEQSVDSNEEIWSGEVDMDWDMLDTEFVVKYVADGVEYWDNNDGANYTMPESAGAYLAPGIEVSVDSKYTRFAGGNNFSINVDAKHSYNKAVEVAVRYTTDGWASYTTLPLSYYRYFRVGYANYILSPNQFDVSKYVNTVRVNESVDSIEFAIVYKKDGEEYWDNNYGHNYTLKKITY